MGTWIPTELFTILEPQDQEISDFFEVPERRSMVFELQNCERVGRDGPAAGRAGFGS